MKKLTLYIALMCFTCFTFGQMREIAQADDHWENGDFSQALKTYKTILTHPTDNPDLSMVYYRMAFCYEALFDFENAVKYYQLSYKKNRRDKEILYLIALAFKQNGQYEEALKYFKKYVRKGDDFIPEAKNHIKSHKTVMALSKSSSAFEVNLNKDLSSKYGDFAPCYVKDNNTGLIFTSSRLLSDSQSYKRMNLYYTIKQGTHWTIPVALDTSINKNSEGVVSFDKKRNVIFFTSCNTPKGKIGNCQILYSFLNGEMSGEPLPLNWSNADTIKKYLTGHPSFSNELDLLFFASDMPGGYGGKDIWVSKYDRTSDSWATPVNLGPEINTEGNELFPYISATGDLYFSSSGKATLGGLDIYKATKTGNLTWGNAENMKPPINSSGDDFGIILNNNGNSGYFSSARKGGLGMDDIYDFKMSEPNVNDKIIENQTSSQESDIQSLKQFFNKELCTVKIDSILITKFKVYPNPNKGNFAIDFKVNQVVPLTIRIHNTLGNIVYTENVLVSEGLFSKQIDLQNFSSGVYYVQILYNCQQIITEKIIKQ